MAPPPATHWSCWYAGQARIECRLRSGVDHPDAPLPSLHGAAGNFLQLLRRQATRLLGRPVYIPLLGEPVDHEDLPALAQAVLCGTQAGCHAQYHPDPLAAFAGWSAEAFADLHDPLLAPDDEG